MRTTAARFWTWRRMRRLAALGAAGALPCLAAIAAYMFFGDRIPRRVYWKTGLAFLIGLEAAYAVALAGCLTALPVLAVLAVRARRLRMRRPVVARGLLFCGALLSALVLAEVSAAAWHAWEYRFANLAAPASTDESWRPPLWLSRLDAFTLRTEFPPAPKGDGSIRLAVVGESSAVGVPLDYWISIGRLVARQLEQAVPGCRVTLEVLARSGDTLERQHEMLQYLRHRPDVLIVYCGHNEFVGRLVSSRNLRYYHDEQPPSTHARLATWAERVSPLCGLIRESADKCRVAIPPSAWAGRGLVDVPCYTDTEYATLLTDFERRLERIVAYAEQIGSLPILIIPPANDAGFEPNRSYLPASTPYLEREAFARTFLAARRRERDEPLESLAEYRKLLARYPKFAELHYRLGGLLRRFGAWDEAYRQFVAARDLDGMPSRAPTPFQNAYRSVAARHACILIDSQAYFHAIGRNGQLDDELFQDAMHPSLRGQIALAQAVLQGIAAWRALGWPAATPAPVLDPARCIAEFTIGPYEWSKVCRWGINFNSLMAPLRYDPGERRARQDACAQAAVAIDQGRTPEAVGLVNIGVPRRVPIIAGAAVLTAPGKVDEGTSHESNTNTSKPPSGWTTERPDGQG